MLNRVAPAFCHSLQQLLWQDVLLSLCRLTDPITTGKGKSEKANLTILRVHPLIPDQELQRRVQQVAERAKLETEFARALRNRRLAHRELPLVERQVAIPMPSATISCVETAFDTIREVMNLVECHYLNSTVMYDQTIQALGGVDALIATLQVGEKTIKAERQKYGVL